MSANPFTTPPAKRIKVQSDDDAQPRWLLVPDASRTVKDLLKSLLHRFHLSDSSNYDLCLEGIPILSDEDVALVRDGEQLHLRRRKQPSVTTPTPTPQPSLHIPDLSTASTPDRNQEQTLNKRKRILSEDGKRRRNLRNRKREKRRKIKRRHSENQHLPSNVPTKDLLDHLQHPTSSSQPVLIPATASQVNGEMQTDCFPEVYQASHHVKEAPPPAKESVPSRETARQRVSEDHDAVVDHAIAYPENAVSGLNMATLDCTVHNPTVPRQSDTILMSKEASKIPPCDIPTVQAASPAPNDPMLSYVFLQKVSIEPFGTKATAKNRNEEQDRCEGIEPQNNQNHSNERHSHIERRLVVSDRARDNTSDLIRVEMTSTDEKTTREDMVAKAPEKDPVVREENCVSAEINERQNVAERPEALLPHERSRPQEEANDYVGCVPENITETMTANIKVDSERPHSKEVTASQPESLHTTPMPTTLRHTVDERKQTDLDLQNGTTGDLFNAINHTNETNPTWKPRQHPIEAYSLDKRAAGPNESWERPISQTPLPQKDLENSSQKEVSRGTIPIVSKETAPHLEREAATDVKVSGVPDVINLVEEDENNAPLSTKLPKVQAPCIAKDRSELTSPQSVLMPPSQPQLKGSGSRTTEIDAVKTAPSRDDRAGQKSNLQVEGGPDHGKSHSLTMNSGRSSRRKSKRPKRLRKPGAIPSSDVKNTALEQETSLLPDAGLNALEKAKRSAVEDLKRVNSRASAEEQELTQLTSKGDREHLTNVPESCPISNPKVSSTPENQNAPTQNRKALKGGLSTLAALRVAKAHGALISSAPKEKPNFVPKRDEAGRSSRTAMNERDRQSVIPDSKQSKAPTRKKNKRNKKSSKASRYLNEEQRNRSFFVGSDNRPEMLLPPLELLELPEDADQLKQNPIEEENVLEAQEVGQSFFEPLNRGEEIPVASERDSAGKTEKSLPVPITDERARDRHIQSALHNERVKAEGPRPSLDFPVDNETIPKPPPNRNIATVGNGDSGRQRITKDRSSSEANAARSSKKSDFRNDLVDMLQSTSQTLAEVWSKWDDHS